MGSVSFPMASFYVLSMLTTWKRQQTYLQMTVIFRERKMANIRQKKYEVNFSPWRAREIIRAVWQPQSPGAWPAPRLPRCHLWEPGYLSSTQGWKKVESIEGKLHMDQSERNQQPYVCLFKFWIPNYSPIVYCYSFPNTHSHTHSHSHSHIFIFLFLSPPNHYTEQSKCLAVNYHVSVIRYYYTYRVDIKIK